jgi:cytochrome c biogenesis protein CcmG, thiol:disulfide interchange protein DsbE
VVTRRSTARFLLLAAPFLGLLHHACRGPAGDAAPAAIVGPAAPLSFADLGRIHTELAARRGRPVLLNFWATWCIPCVEELPDLAALAREYASGGPDFLGVSFDAWVTGDGAETEEKVRGALARAGVGYANLIYRGDQDPLLEAFRLPGPIPHSILYDGEGKMVASWNGKVEIAELREAVASLQ